MRNHDVAGLTDAELDRARRELAASLALARPDSPVRVPILSHMNAIDTELTCRGIRMCGCGLATDNAAMMDGHLFEYPGHEERDLGRYLAGRQTPEEKLEPMAAIGIGKDDPRRWVKAAYHLVDAVECGRRVRRTSFPPDQR